MFSLDMSFCESINGFNVTPWASVVSLPWYTKQAQLLQHLFLNPSELYELKGWLLEKPILDVF